MLSIPSAAKADPKCYEENFTVPPREFVEVDKVRYMAFDLESSGLLMAKLSCGYFFKQRSAVLSKRANQQSLALEEYREINTLQTEKINFLQDDRTRIVDMWKEENKKRHKAENKSSYGWTVAAFASAVAVSFGVAFVLK
jgi:hypothetical protein